MRSKVDSIIDEVRSTQNFDLLYINLYGIKDFATITEYVMRRTILRYNDEPNKRDREVHQYK